MEAILTEAAKQAPSLVVLVVLVVIFLRSMAARDKSHERTAAQFSAHLEKRDCITREISESCHIVQRECIEAMKDVRNAMTENAHVMRKVNDQLGKH